MNVRQSAALRRQRGLVLLLIVLSMLAIGGTLLLTGFVGGKSAERRLAEGASADQRLLFARDALLGYAVGNISDVGRPGQLPAPDNLQDGNYDGNQNYLSCLDGTAVNGLPVLTVAGSANFRCIGKLPWRTLGISLDTVDEFDATGNVPWYAVSANLSANNICLDQINPTTVSAAPISYVCGSTTAPPFPWLKVCDQSGKLLSDRVAFVVIVPGAPIETAGRIQVRSGSPRPQPGDYLDAIPVPAGWSALPAAQRCTTYDNAALSNEFVTADTTSAFNDRLLYVTIDELMARVESRVAQQVREALITFAANPQIGRYPWLAPVGNPSSATDAFIAAVNTNSGLVPFHTQTQTTGQRFKTEVNWTIGTTAANDTKTPATNYTTTFLCFSGTYRCRLRTTPGSTVIPRTVTLAQFANLKTSGVVTPDVSCKYSTLTTLNCDTYTYTQTQVVSYDVCRRTPAGTNSAGDGSVCGGGGYIYYGTFSGIQTRTIILDLTAIQASGPAPANGLTISADASNFVRRSLTTASMSGFGLLSATDSWVPTSPGTAPFDQTSAFPTGYSSTDGNGIVVASNIRVYPELPAWYFAHKWNEYIYAAYSPDASPAVGGTACSANCLSAGARNGLNAVVISAGKMINSQNRYAGTPTVDDFLETPNNTGTTTRIFAEQNANHTSTYIDTVATIPR